eukprot:scaffold5918_cov124-Isochrysis_galbana.AAC.10
MAVGQSPKRAHQGAPPSSPVHIVVRKPPRGGAPDRKKEGRDECMPLSQQGSRDEERDARRERGRFAPRAPFPIALLHQLSTKLTEAQRQRCGLRHPNRRGGGHRQAREHMHSFIRVKSLHCLGGIRVRIAVNPVGTRRVCGAPLG